VSRLAVAQFAPGTDTGANLDSIAQFAERAAEAGASLLVLPEYSSWFSPEMNDGWVRAAQPIDGEFVTGLVDVAGRVGIHLVAGFMATGDASRVRNAVVAVDPAGAVVAEYDKLHLYDAFGVRESEWVRPGDIDTPQTFAWEGFTVGLQTCYDLRFPEVTRRLVDAGADLVVVPSEWVRGPLKEHHWRTLVTARALENTIYVGAADHTPPVGVGNSMIVDPMGVAIAEIGEEAGLAIAEVTLERIAAVRAVNPALALRRFGVVPVNESR